jgi:hypothetical protein
MVLRAPGRAHPTFGTLWGVMEPEDPLSSLKGCAGVYPQSGNRSTKLD